MHEPSNLEFRYLCIFQAGKCSSLPLAKGEQPLFKWRLPRDHTQGRYFIKRCLFSSRSDSIFPLCLGANDRGQVTAQPKWGIPALEAFALCESEHLANMYQQELGHVWVRDVSMLDRETQRARDDIQALNT